MAKTVSKYRVFIATPKGLEEERRLFQVALQDFNDELPDRDVIFTPVGWEDTLGGVGRPQGMINADLVTCDYFVLMLWDRWGHPTNTDGPRQYSSGCEEEFQLACDCLADHERPMKQVIVFFKDVDPRQLKDPGPQLQRVLEFKLQLEESKKHLFMQFGKLDIFQKQLRRFLSKWTAEHGSVPPEHVELLAMGVKVWNQWRARYAGTSPKLAHADLRARYLTGFDLRGADLTRADLSDADLSNSDLSGALLNGALLAGTNLFRATLTGADLRSTIVANAHVREADFRGCRFGHTVVSQTDLSHSQGLTEVEHDGSSEIGIDTIYKSRGKIPEAFLRGCSVPEEFIAYIGSMVGRPIEFYSCFISYSTKDQEFAERLHADLQNVGVRCWFAPANVEGGRKLHEQIDKAIRLHDKLLLILSEHSISSSWVRSEIAKARERELNQGNRVLFPVRLVPFEMLRDWECFDHDTGKDSAREIREYFIPDFSNWKDHDSYQTAFRRLVKDLKAEPSKRPTILASTKAADPAG